MMRLLKTLQKSRQFWFLCIVGIAFFLLRLPSLIEPYWYGDEGIYETIGKALANNLTLYKDIWDNKPPLLYLIYSIFAGDQFSVRLASLIIGLFSVFIFFLLAKQVFKNFRITATITSFFALLLATPLLEGNIANAENFMLLPILIAGLLLFKISEKTKPAAFFFIGLLLGTAFLIKAVALFDALAFISFYILINFPEHRRFTFAQITRVTMKFHSFLLSYTAGFFAPLTIAAVFFLIKHALTDFIFASYFGNIAYVGENNMFFIPQGLLVTKLILLILALSAIIWKRRLFSPPLLFVIIWLTFSTFNIFFSQRPYTHYLLNLLPAASLLLGFLMTNKKTVQSGVFLLLIGLLVLIGNSFNFYFLKKSIPYYLNAIDFVNGKKDTSAYQKFFDTRTPRDYQIGNYIRNHTKSSEKIFVWGDSPQIYAIAQRLPFTKYTAAYHILQVNALKQTQDAIDKNGPRYIVTLSEAPLLPFRLSMYYEKFSINGAIVYERIF